MKPTFLTHPFTVIILFSLLPITVAHTGHPNQFYNCPVLPNENIHARLSLLGTAVLLFTTLTFRRSRKYPITLLLDTIAIWFLYESLIISFCHQWSVSCRTFPSAIPILTFSLFLYSSLGLLATDTARFARPSIF